MADEGVVDEEVDVDVGDCGGVVCWVCDVKIGGEGEGGRCCGCDEDVGHFGVERREG